MTGSKLVNDGRDVEDFLGGLPLSTKTYTYEGKKQFEEIARLEHRRLEQSLRHLQILCYKHRSPSFRKDFSLKLNVGVRQFYNPTLHILILRMTLPEHSEITGHFHDAVMRALKSMGFETTAIFRYGGADINVGGGNTKQPDWGWGPARRPGVTNRPSVVLEAGLSEPETKLRNDARMWVDPTRGEANMAITIKINRRKPMITIQTWEWDSNSQRPHVTQSCVIEKTGDNITVSKQALVIPFNLLFRRPPSIPREIDIRLQKSELAKIGAGVWEMQEL
ncbi:uncharacterized protein N7500_001320 [Penicillium coprophilum]|uniref:uncharacterized protein n=1 Tax=Penicillium coprophilum TaxID=36646 RepID=UPI00239BC264|nr:uncharacterized protein N7500_001320 [Penicillium coprophilum]KAJ5178621.1 hypothetical protein N7500_001320 [Penicillium coprophilum]